MPFHAYFSNARSKLPRAARGPPQHSQTNTKSTRLPTTHHTTPSATTCNFIAFDFQFHDKPTTMAASRKTPSSAPAQSGAKQEHFDITTYARLHAQANLLVTADTRLKQVVDKIR